MTKLKKLEGEEMSKKDELADSHWHEDSETKEKHRIICKNDFHAGYDSRNEEIAELKAKLENPENPDWQPIQHCPQAVVVLFYSKSQGVNYGYIPINISVEEFVKMTGRTHYMLLPKGPK